jgi:hypothetical protein
MIKTEVVAALRHVLTPLVRVVLRNGVMWSDFAEVAKEVFVEVARDDYGVQGRPTNASRVALITGLSRREVARVKEVLLGERPRDAAQSRISQILTAWHVDPRFLSKDGGPATLPLTGDEPSLEALLKHYAGDTPHGAIIKELEELRLIERSADGYRALARDYIRSASDPDLIRQASVALHDHVTTIAHNVDANRRGPPRFERMATHSALPRRLLPAFEAYLRTEGQAFLEKVDSWLSTRSATTTAVQDERSLRVGVGVYEIQEQKKAVRS